jgi:hypothetical protein
MAMFIRSSVPQERNYIPQLLKCQLTFTPAFIAAISVSTLANTILNVGSLSWLHALPSGMPSAEFDQPEMLSKGYSIQGNLWTMIKAANGKIVKYTLPYLAQSDLYQWHASLANVLMSGALYTGIGIGSFSLIDVATGKFLITPVMNVRMLNVPKGLIAPSQDDILNGIEIEWIGEIGDPIISKTSFA